MATKTFSQGSPVSEISDMPLGKSIPIERPNSLAFLFVVDNFFDGARPFLQSLRSPTLGGAYGRRLSNEWSLNASLRYCYRDYIYSLNAPLQIGDITQRSIVFGDISLHRRIFSRNSSSVSAFAGLSLRAGAEFMYVGKFYFEPLIDKYDLLDPGVIGGLRGYQSLPWNFGLSLEAKAAFYIWTDPKRYPYPYYAYVLPNRPTSYLFAAQAAIHYNF